MITTQELTRPRNAKTGKSTCAGLQVRTDAPLVRTPTAESLNATLGLARAKPCTLGRRGTLPSVKAGVGNSRQTIRVPVVDTNRTPLMPCLASKARHLLKEGKASARWNKLGMFYIQLKWAVEKPNIQPLVLGIDPGSKFEGYTVSGTKDTVLNIECEAPYWVKDAVEQRRDMRRTRRSRNCRRRERRNHNRLARRTWLPPSTRSRWEVKYRIPAQLVKILPIDTTVVEDVKAPALRGWRRWNVSFSSIEVGKQHLYKLLRSLGLKVILRTGMETKELRDKLGLEKIRSKSKPVFEAHCVDSWCLAASVTSAEYPTNTSLYYITPIQFHRRQLHRFQPKVGGGRYRYGGTLSLGIKRGTIVKHPKWGITHTGGNMRNNRISLHKRGTNERLSRCVKIEDIKILSCTRFSTHLLTL